MKFKPGDLVIIRCENQEYNGRVAEIIQKAPSIPFMLPDGFRHVRRSLDEWVIRICGDPITVPIYTWDGEPSSERITHWGVGDGTEMEKIGNVDEIVLAWAGMDAETKKGAL